jgi:hypothetical protein
MGWAEMFQCVYKHGTDSASLSCVATHTAYHLSVCTLLIGQAPMEKSKKRQENDKNKMHMKWQARAQSKGKSGKGKKSKKDQGPMPKKPWGK